LIPRPVYVFCALHENLGQSAGRKRFRVRTGCRKADGDQARGLNLPAAQVQDNARAEGEPRQRERQPRIPGYQPG
jgi:hypothetical protein